jgi:hypothetical protein
MAAMRPRALLDKCTTQVNLETDLHTGQLKDNLGTLSRGMYVTAACAYPCRLRMIIHSMYGPALTHVVLNVGCELITSMY